MVTFMQDNEYNEHMNEKSLAETMLGISADEIGETRLPNAVDGAVGEAPFTPGQTIASDYIVSKSLSSQGSEAQVYVARRDGKQYAIKVYHQNCRPSQTMVSALINHSCPYVAELYDCGTENGRYYEIYKYYGNGTLEERGKCTAAFIRDVVIPSLNEGLAFLHSLGDGGIVHGDIKPSNIFVSDDEARVVIGDFGISNYLDSSGKLIDDMRGTPEYAPRAVSLFGKMRKTPAYDYGSLGLVLIKLATGHSLFEGLTHISEIMEAWERGIEVPSSIDSRLRRLINGLISEDEEKRFGYDEVKKWCDGEFLQMPEASIYSDDDLIVKRDIEPFLFGVFGDRIVTVSTLAELANAMSDDWEHAKKVIVKNSLLAFLEQFSEELRDEIREISKRDDSDAMLFHALYRLQPNTRIIYKGRDYGDARAFLNSLADGATADMQAIIDNGLFEYYLKQNAYPQDLISTIHSVLSGSKISKELRPKLLYYIFAKEKTFTVNGAPVADLQTLIDIVAHMSAAEVSELSDNVEFVAWLYAIGFREESLQLMEL